MKVSITVSSTAQKRGTMQLAKQLNHIPLSTEQTKLVSSSFREAWQHYSYRIVTSIVMMLVLSTASFATSITVTNGKNDGDGSLSDAVEGLTGPDTIFIDSNVDTILLTSQIAVDRDVVIIGNGGQSTFIDGNGMTRHFFIGDTGDSIKVEIHHLTLTRGFVNGEGGSIYINQNQELTLKGVTLSDNQVGNNQRGGAIYFKGTLRLLDCILTNNYSPFTAGAISSIVPSSGISSAAKLFISNSIISGNSSPQGGGGIVAFCDTVSIVNSLITGNQANSGAGLYFGSRPGTDSTYAFIANSTIAGNRCEQEGTASGRGAGIFIWNNTNLHMINTIVGNNTLDNDGGYGTDIYFEGTGTFHDLGSNLISDTSYINTNYDNISFVDIHPEFVRNVHPSSVPTTQGDFRLKNCSPAIDMGKDTLGLAMGVDVAGLPRVYNGTIDIGAIEKQNLPSTIVTNNDNNGLGSLRDIIALSCDGDTITFETSTDGDTIFLSGHIQLDSRLTLIGNDTSNTIIDGSGLDQILRIGEEDSIRIEGLTIQNGMANGVGGAIFNGYGVLSIKAVKIANNMATGDGGGIYSLAGEVLIENSVIHSNSTGKEGGGLYCNDCKMEVVNSSISNNTAVEGGGVYNVQGDLLIDNSSISNNTSNRDGGGIYNDLGDASIDNSLVNNNQAGFSGGGFYNYKGAVLIDNGSISNNTSNGDGGGIYNSLGAASIDNSLVNNNQAGFGGGGIYNQDEATLVFTIKIRQTKVIGNSANMGGGVMNKSNFESYNSIIADNQGNNNGAGGIYLSNDGSISTKTILVNTTVAGNSTGISGAGGIMIDDGQLTLMNSIVTNNSGKDISNNNDFGMISDNGYNIIGVNNLDSDDIDSTTLTGVDANFIRVAAPGDSEPSDLRLWCTSPAINAGTSVTTGLTDVLGLPRIVDGHIDIGAHEYFSGQLPTELILNNSATVKAFEVGKSIKAQVTLEELDHVFRVEENVVMDPIFSIENGATLEVNVDTCGRR